MEPRIIFTGHERVSVWLNELKKSLEIDGRPDRPENDSFVYRSHI